MEPIDKIVLQYSAQQVELANPFHDLLGRFAHGTGGQHSMGTSRLSKRYELAGQRTAFSGGTETKLVHGSVQGVFGDTRLSHAWVVQPDGRVWEPTTNKPWPADVFKAFFHPKVDKVYSTKQVLANLAKTHSYGPWTGVTA